MDRKQDHTEKSLRGTPEQIIVTNAAVDFSDSPGPSFLRGTPLALMTLALLASLSMVALDNAIICTLCLVHASVDLNEQLTRGP